MKATYEFSQVMRAWPSMLREILEKTEKLVGCVEGKSTECDDSHSVWGR